MADETVFNFLGLAPDPERIELGHQVAIIQAPLENTTSFQRGTTRGPQAILAASQQLEAFDIERAFNLSSIGYWVSSGEALSGKKNSEAVALIGDQVQRALERGLWPITLGGEKTICLGPVQALHKQHSEFSVLQIDAHANLRRSFEGSEWSQACTLRRVFEMGLHHVGVGIRSYSWEESEFIAKHQIKIFSDQWTEDPGASLKTVSAALKEQVYITISTDAFNPAECPGTAHPQPGGLSWQRSVALLETVFLNHEVLGVDVTDLRPLPDSAQSELFVAKLIAKVIALQFSEGA